MICVLVGLTVVYAASFFYGIALDAMFVVASLSMVCAWLPRVVLAPLFHNPGSMWNRLRNNGFGREFCPEEKHAKMASRIQYAAVILFVAVVAILFFGSGLAVHDRSAGGMDTALLDWERRILLLAAASLGALYTSVFDMRSEWGTKMFEYEWGQAFKQAFGSPSKNE